MRSLPAEARENRIFARVCGSADAADTSSRKIVINRLVLPMRLGVPVVFLRPWRLSLVSIRRCNSRSLSAIHTRTRGLLSSPSDLCGIKLRLRYAPEVAVVGTNSEINVGESMSESTIPT